MKTLLDLYKSHTGKVSDKWALYLREYDRLFAPYREQAISMLEIGVQNGGSLEIWSQYFPNAQKFVGCDINPDCAKLTYADPRIAVIVGDATTPETQAQVLAQSASFDLIIEDGSHTSSDIVKAFARYFPALKTGGLFVAEDLHCSYWEDFEGGLFYPYSSITFFKHLADMVNHEHWGVEKSRTELIAGFKQVLDVEFDETLLGQISSVEFVNSICVLRKSDPAMNSLGCRIIAGKTEAVVGGHLSLAGTVLKAPAQTANIWSNLVMPPVESYQDLIHEINIGKELLDQQGALVEQIGSEAQALQTEVEQLKGDVQAKQVEVEQLRSDVQSKHAEVAYLNHLVSAMKSSRSWRYTAALRIAGSFVRPVVRVLRRIQNSAQQNGGYVGLAFKVFTLVRKEGWHGIRWRLFGTQPVMPVVTPEGQAVDRNDYQTWIELYDSLDEQAVENIQRKIKSLSRKPKISVVMPVYNAPLNFLEEAIRSVQSQIYDNWELCIADDASTDNAIRPMLESFAQQDSRIKVSFRKENGHISAASNSAIALVTGEFIALLDNDDLLPRHALFHVAKVIVENPDVALIYSDEDKIDVNGRRHHPYFKSDWNPDLIYSHNMFSHLGVYRTSLVQQVGGFKLGMEGSQDYDLLLRCLEKIEISKIIHLPYVLYHWRVHPSSTAMSSDAKPYAMIAGEKAINNHFERTGVKGKVKLTSYGYTPFYELPEEPPLVSIIIPTRNRHDLVRRCIDSLRDITEYPNYEILLMDNGSDDPESLNQWSRYSKSGVRVIRVDGPFNFSAINNKGVEESKGDIVVLLNNDTEVIHSDWLALMVSHALRPGVGVVGAKLLYKNQKIQHSGIVLGLGGVAGHVHYGYPADSYGYFGHLKLTRAYSAVTAACFAVRRQNYLQFGGLDETDFGIAFNDVDFCLKLGFEGYRTVYAADVTLYHHESLSRGSDESEENRLRFLKEESCFKRKWTNVIENDPYYSPNLTLNVPDCSLAWPPRVMKF